MKKIFISADLEGCSGVTAWCETEIGQPGYQEARRQMSLEVAAACRAAIAAGYEVVVKDSHDSGRNIDANLLPRGVQLIRGWMNSPLSMMGGLDETFAGAMYIGYHSPAGSNTSPLAHTMDNNKFNWLKINGNLVSEFDIHALLADEMGVPSLFLSGDKGICLRAETVYPGIGTFSTKEGIGGATWSVHPEEAIEGIEKTVEKALKNPAKVRPLEDSYTLVICFKNHRDARSASWYPGAEQLDEYTVSYTASTPFELATARMFMTK
ncbi:MAG: M55 family metallopeptidase, partial [Acetatifactor sp.]